MNEIDQVTLFAPNSQSLGLLTTPAAASHAHCACLGNRHQSVMGDSVIVTFNQALVIKGREMKEE